MQRKIAQLLMFLAMFAGGCSSVNMSTQQYRSARLPKYPAPPSELTLKTGDRIVVRLHTLSAVPLEMTEVIDEQGFIKLPHIGTVKIGDMTTAKAESTIEQTYVDAGIYRKDAIQVAIVPPESEFYVSGYVNKPGTFQFTRNLTVSAAIAMAGGVNEYADRRVRKLRRKGQEYIIDAVRVQENKEQDRIVEPGDIIEVPRGWL